MDFVALVCCEGRESCAGTALLVVVAEGEVLFRDRSDQIEERRLDCVVRRAVVASSCCLNRSAKAWKVAPYCFSGLYEDMIGNVCADLAG